MKAVLFAGRKKQYKANLHCHTTVSDGSLTPEQIKDAYGARGYSIVAYTDHGTLNPHPHLNDDAFLSIHSCEVNINQNAPDRHWENIKTYHLNLYATRSDWSQSPPLPQMDYVDVDAINQYIKDRSDEGYLVCYNHPYWSLQSSDAYCRLKGLFAMEIYNHGCETEGRYGYHPQAYDEMLRSGNGIYCVSADDNHNHHPLGSAGWDSFGGYVMVNSVSLRYEDVMDALRDGNFFSSQGPDIKEIVYEDGKLTVSCSEASLIAVYTDGRKCYLQHGEGMTGAEILLTRPHQYVRVMVRDKEKKDANTNAFWLERY